MNIKVKELFVTNNNKTYKVNIIYKPIKSCYVRFKDDTFVVTSSRYFSTKTIIDFINNNFEKLTRRKVTKEPPVGENYIYLYGKKVNIDSPISNLELKKNLYSTIEKLVRNNETRMKIPHPYNIKIKNMSTRYGSNSSQTYTLNFTTKLIHYSYEIIESVVIHELTHYYVKGHQKNFYNILYRFCPNYKILKHKLDRGIYK